MYFAHRKSNFLKKNSIKNDFFQQNLDLIGQF